jgi:plasmid maintenance system killer protein
MVGFDLGNWRVIFEFEGQHVTNVDLVDYH